MIEHDNIQLSVRKQCLLLAVTRSQVYYSSKRVDEDVVTIMNEMRELYEKYPFYGYRRMHVALKRKGYIINRKKVQRLMKLAGIQAIYPRKKQQQETFCTRSIHTCFVISNSTAQMQLGELI